LRSLPLATGKSFVPAVRKLGHFATPRGRLTDRAAVHDNAWQPSEAGGI
jgi:hypothetical protein